MPDRIQILASDMPAYGAAVSDMFRMGDMTDAMRLCAQEAREQARDSFDAETAPDGEAWPEWQFRRLDAPEEHPTLYVSGALMRSYTEEGATGHVERYPSGRAMEAGSALPYAAVHQEGAVVAPPFPMIHRSGTFTIGPHTRLNVPPRRVAGWREDTLDRCEQHLYNEMDGWW